MIRAGLPGVLVVQGGPGTGKTAVALHRAAYLLYTHRAQLTKQGVLILGPNATFLRYISQVLPSLAETGVLLATLGDMFPGVRARAAEPPADRRAQGPASTMLDVLAGAVADRQTVPDDYVEVDHDGYPLRIERSVCEDARAAARRTGRPHNMARADLRDRGDPRAVAADRRADRRRPAGRGRTCSRRPTSRRPGGSCARTWTCSRRSSTCGRCSPRARCCATCSATPDRLVVGRLRRRRRALLLREPRRRLDAGRRAAARRAGRAARRGRHAAQAGGRAGSGAQAIEYAEGVLEIVEGSRSLDFEDDEEEVLSAIDVVDASAFAERYEVIDTRTAAERAAADRTWVFGHVIVDEAQELSPMAWRLLMRRVPEPVDDRGRRRRADLRAGRHDDLGAGLRAVRGAALAAGRADRQLPHPGRGDGGGRGRARRGRPGAAAAAVGACRPASRRGRAGCAPDALAGSTDRRGPPGGRRGRRTAGSACWCRRAARRSSAGR